jgi:enamine deaminase RidA (YjgF/YER057c/UK114 family)
MKIIRLEPGKVLSGAVRAGRFVFVSGTVPDNLSADVSAQTKEVLAKIDALLKKAGSHKSLVVSASIWLTDIRNRDAMNIEWLKWMDPNNPPARATVEAKLADARMLVEIACVAVLAEDDDGTVKPAKKSAKVKVSKLAKTTKPAKKVAAKVESKSAPDDLSVIEGIGPKIAKLLMDSGVSTYKALSKTKVPTIAKMLEAAGPRFRIANPGTWPEQAALLAAGNRAAFEKLTAQLKGGVK